MHWQKWHTLDDAAETVMNELFRLKPEDWARCVFLIPDEPKVRRILKRALERQGLWFLDPRDPTQVRLEESIKWALLPLEVVSQNYARSTVTSWLRWHGGIDTERNFRNGRLDH